MPDQCILSLAQKSSNLNSRGDTFPWGSEILYHLPNGQVCPLEFYLADKVWALCQAFRPKNSRFAIKQKIYKV